jgi:hypothetical protein
MFDLLTAIADKQNVLMLFNRHKLVKQAISMPLTSAGVPSNLKPMQPYDASKKTTGPTANQRFSQPPANAGKPAAPAPLGQVAGPVPLNFKPKTATLPGTPGHAATNVIDRNGPLSTDRNQQTYDGNNAISPGGAIT